MDTGPAPGVYFSPLRDGDHSTTPPSILTRICVPIVNSNVDRSSIGSGVIMKPVPGSRHLMDV